MAKYHLTNEAPISGEAPILLNNNSLILIPTPSPEPAALNISSITLSPGMSIGATPAHPLPGGVVIKGLSAGATLLIPAEGMTNGIITYNEGNLTIETLGESE